MSKIADIFQKDIRRKIEEVVKVEQHDEKTVKIEIEEYVATEAIKEHFYHVYDEVAKYSSDPHEGTGIWVSGFFGSGKSSFAKLLGYTLANREVSGKSSSDRFIENVQDEQMTGYLRNINSRFNIHAIIFDVSMDRGVRTASERITEIMYKALLRELDYAEDFDLAELEITLEIKGKLDEFITRFNEKFSLWKEERDMAMGIVEASVILHEMMPDVFTTGESWSNSLGIKEDTGEFTGRADITPKKLAERTFELINRRKPGYGVIYVIDEVGQYVSRSVEKMLDLQAIIQSFGIEGKKRFKAREATVPTWIIVTSQEKLNEVVDALDSKKIELARLQDRFPITIDLKSSDIQEVTSKRVLQKNNKGEKLLTDLFTTNEGRLKTYCILERTSRNTSINRKDFVNLYPYLPYQIDLCIDIVAGLRLERGAQRHVGGSNRTIIKQAQQMLIHPRTNMSENEVATLVTLDRVYELLYTGNLLPSEVTGEVDNVIKILPGNEMALKVAKSIALLEAVKDLPRTIHNIAVSLYPSVNSDSILKEVEEAVKELEKAQFIRETEDGYKLLTVQEKNWDTTRAGIEPKPKERNRIKEELLDEIFSEPKTRTYSYKKFTTFKIGLLVNDVKKQDGAVKFSIHIAEDKDELNEKRNFFRGKSREDEFKNIVFWLFSLTEEINRLINELYRSKHMITTYSRLRSSNNITPEESACLEDEKRRENRIQQNLKSKVLKAFEGGTGLFQGVEKDGSSLGNNLIEIVTGMLDYSIPKIYTKLEIGARKIKGKEAEQFLTDLNLEGLPPVFYDTDDGLNLVVKQGNKYIPNINCDTAREIFDHIKSQSNFGDEVTGKSLEEKFQSPPYGWERDILRLVLAVLFRGGVIEVTYQGGKYKDYSNPGVREAFTSNTGFKKSTFSPRERVNLHVLYNASENYEKITGTPVNIDENAIDNAYKELARKDRDILIPLKAKIDALSLPLKDKVGSFAETIEVILNSSSDDCVKDLANKGMTYKKNRDLIRKIDKKLTGEAINSIKEGRNIVNTTVPLLEKLILSSEISSKIDELRAIFGSEDFYEKIEGIRINSKLIKSYYKTIYEKEHNKRKDAFEKIIDVIRSHNSFNQLNDGEKESVLNPFIVRCCNNLIMTDKNSCDNCKATIDQIESDIFAIPGMEQTAIRKIEKITQPKEKIEHIKISKIITGYLEKPEDIDMALEKIKKELLKLIAEGYKISLH